jgi:hypothetical protein
LIRFLLLLSSGAMPLLLVAGHVLNKWYQEAKLIADDIAAADDTMMQVESKSLLEYQW